MSWWSPPLAPWSLAPTATRPCGTPVRAFPGSFWSTHDDDDVAQRVRMSTVVSWRTCNLNLRLGRSRPLGDVGSSG
jgi:hypothetical protein